jgi:ribosomal-protein-alanine N-acetyltransferase
MEKMPFHDQNPELAAPSTASTTTAAPPPPAQPSVSSDWRESLPVLTGAMLTLRELELGDAPSLLALLSTAEVARFISPPPTTVEGFERFIRWAQEQRRKGEYICFAVVPHGMSVAVGIFQVRRLEPRFGTAEWGFALASAYWGTGMFVEGARLTVDFAIETLGVHRLEARAAVANGRGNGALRKLGAVREGILRRSFHRHGRYLDQMMWAILDSDWIAAKALPKPKIRLN